MLYRAYRTAASVAAITALAAGACRQYQPTTRPLSSGEGDRPPAVHAGPAARSPRDLALEEGHAVSDLALIEGAMATDPLNVGLSPDAPTALLDAPNASTRPVWNEAAEVASGRRFDPIHFEHDSNAISGPARRALEEYARWMNDNPTSLMKIEGHCDSDGSQEYNYNLGMARAQAAREIMAGLGVRPERMFILSFGEERPAAPEFSPSDKALNRRAEFRAYESSELEVKQVPASASQPPPAPAPPPEPPTGEETP